VARLVAAPGNAAPPGEGGAAPRGIDHVKLADIAALVAGDEECHDLGGGDAFGEEAQAARPEERVGEGLRRDRADAAARMAAALPGGEGLGGDGDAEGAGRRIAGDDGPGHRDLVVTPS